MNNVATVPTKKFSWNRFIRRSLVMIFAGFAGVFVIQFVFNNYVTHNISISAPTGYYFTLPISKITKGNRYLLCLDNPTYLNVMFKLGLLKIDGQCSNRSPYLLKKVVGVPNDLINITESGVLVNSVKQLNSKLIKSHNGIDLLPQKIGESFTLQQNEYFVMGDTPTSYDSRYYGIIKTSQFKKRAIGFLSDQ